MPFPLHRLRPRVVAFLLRKGDADARAGGVGQADNCISIIYALPVQTHTIPAQFQLIRDFPVNGLTDYAQWNVQPTIRRRGMIIIHFYPFSVLEQ